MSTPRYHVILNSSAGTADATGITAEALAEMFATRGMEAVIDARADHPFAERIAEALAGPAEIIVAGGGDGTITGLSNALMGTEKTLAVLPLGTVNALARDLGIPLELEAAVDLLAQGEPRRIDVGLVNGEAFLHKVVVGVIPGVAAGREHLRGRRDLGAVLGMLRYFSRRLARARRLAVAITTDSGDRRVERVQALAVANNAYDEAFGRFFSRERLDAGHLTLYVLKHLTMADVVRLTTEMFLGRWQEDEALQVEKVSGVTIESRKPSVSVMLDGEVQIMETPLVFTMRPLALSVLTPPPQDATEDLEVRAAS
ncbi:diacylglycerol kinase [Arsenicitalea aurantiaca]|uniref:Diacylglycerol kinase n=1 Tax=Arsenicitalea aurantiaca TaxID=1783274 RepID=A0A433XEV4_9HYPH|nr:diacylglycerol kinase family protein [Arsenicitalea aurantiaca]RUT32478.1 diacylglycerol kinase [Arsenicitalea aurantiaca]